MAKNVKAMVARQAQRVRLGPRSGRALVVFILTLIIDLIASITGTIQFDNVFKGLVFSNQSIMLIFALCEDYLSGCNNTRLRLR
jgi:peptidoglycan/LPS O-acetylase OafA/YrhL